MSELVGVPAEHVPIVWPKVKWMLFQAVKRNDGIETIDDVYEDLKERDKQLWVSYNGEDIEAACVSEVRVYKRHKVAALPYIAGKARNNWLVFEPVFVEWAKANGCIALEGYARPGWLRVLQHWRALWTVIRRDL